MQLSQYRLIVKDGMRFRHDAQLRFTVKSGKRVLQDDLTPVESIGGAVTLANYMYNRIAGRGIDWWDPSTGKSIERPYIEIRARKSDILVNDQECTCTTCESG